MAGTVAIGSAAAVADGSGDGARLAPNVAGKPTGATIDVPATGAGQHADEIAIALPRGLKIDRKARPRHCFDEQGANSDCREDSQVGTGTIELSGRGTLLPPGEAHYVADVGVFLAGRRDPGDIIGLVIQVDEPQTATHTSLEGRIVPLSSGPYGAEIRIANPRDAARPPGLDVTLDRITLNLKAKRAIRRTRRAPKRHYFLRNPRTCTGSWPFQVTFRGESGDAVQDYGAACTPR